MASSLTRSIFAAAAMAASGAGAGEGTSARPTEGFRREHAQIKEHLAHLDAMVGNLQGAKADDAKKTMGFVVKFLREHIASHAAWEERALYPVVDKRAETGANRFTATMRWEHQIVGRWIDELARESEKPTPNASAFSRRAYMLLGLIGAHFEEEEDVLLPILDRTMTADQFAKEIGAGHGG